MVPGEADPYCAQRAKRIGAIILTNDSDLLLYEWGNESLVIFFQDLDFLTTEPTSPDSSEFQQLSAQVFSPYKITQHLRVPSLLHLVSILFHVDIPFAFHSQTPSVGRDGS